MKFECEKNDANQHTWSQEELDAYDYADMRKEDGKAQIDAAEKRGENKAKKEAEKKMEEMILEMNNDGIPILKISKFTKKTEEEVSAIVNR